MKTLYSSVLQIEHDLQYESILDMADDVDNLTDHAIIEMNWAKVRNRIPAAGGSYCSATCKGKHIVVKGVPVLRKIYPGGAPPQVVVMDNDMRPSNGVEHVLVEDLIPEGYTCDLSGVMLKYETPQLSEIRITKCPVVMYPIGDEPYDIKSFKHDIAGLPKGSTYVLESLFRSEILQEKGLDDCIIKFPNRRYEPEWVDGVYKLFTLSGLTPKKLFLCDGPSFYSPKDYCDSTKYKNIEDYFSAHPEFEPIIVQFLKNNRGLKLYMSAIHAYKYTPFYEISLSGDQLKFKNTGKNVTEYIRELY